MSDQDYVFRFWKVIGQQVQESASIPEPLKTVLVGKIGQLHDDHAKLPTTTFKIPGVSARLVPMAEISFGDGPGPGYVLELEKEGSQWEPVATAKWPPGGSITIRFSDGAKESVSGDTRCVRVSEKTKHLQETYTPVKAEGVFDFKDQNGMTVSSSRVMTMADWKPEHGDVFVERQETGPTGFRRWLRGTVLVQS